MALISLSDPGAVLLLQMLESQVDVRQKEVEELQKQSQALSQEGKGSDEVDGQRISVEKKFHSLQAPLQKRRGNLMASREIHQFNRDVEDEIVSSKLRVQTLLMVYTSDFCWQKEMKEEQKLKVLMRNCYFSSFYVVWLQ